MHIRNTGESLSRPFPRLQRTRQCRGRTSHSDLKRRTSKCPPSRAASGLPPLLSAATPVSNTPTCWRWSPRYIIHRYRDIIGTISIPFAAPSLHVTKLSIFLRRGLPASAPAVRQSQAQSPRRLAARSSSRSRAATQPICSSNRRRLNTARYSRLSPSVPTIGNVFVVSTSHPSSSSPQPTSR